MGYSPHVIGPSEVNVSALTRRYERRVSPWVGPDEVNARVLSRLHERIAGRGGRWRHVRPDQVINAPTVPTAPALPPTTPTVSATAWLESTQLMHHWTTPRTSSSLTPVERGQMWTCHPSAEVTPADTSPSSFGAADGSAKAAVARRTAAQPVGSRFAIHR